MARQCAALSCPISCERNLFKLLKFPKNKQLRIIWNKCTQNTNNDEYYHSGEEKYLCELHFDEHQWKNFNEKHLKPFAIPTIFFQFRPKDYVKNICLVLLSFYQDESFLLKFLHMLNHASCIEKESEKETQELLKKLGIRLIEFGIQKARIQRKEKLLHMITEENETYKAVLKELNSLE